MLIPKKKKKREQNNTILKFLNSHIWKGIKTAFENLKYFHLSIFGSIRFEIGKKEAGRWGKGKVISTMQQQN